MAKLNSAEKTTTTTRKKKGRPSLLDLQKRSLKEQHQLRSDFLILNNQNPKLLQNPSSHRRSTRRNPNPNPNSASDEEDDVDNNLSTRRKKLKHVLKLPKDEDDAEPNSASDEPGSSGSNPRKRKIHSIASGSVPDKVEKHSAATNQTSHQQGSKLDDGPSTPLPDQKLLLFILDRLQKKDTYGVFSDPVDPEELPDYFEVITDPMDFSTVRKKLGNCAYSSLEQFEKDIYLLCSNAMQYNSSDTVYFRQARAIQELAKKNFDNLRQDSDDDETENRPEPEPQPEPEPEPPRVVRRGRPPKNAKRPPGRPPLERTKSPLDRAKPGPSQATLATPGGNTNRSNNNDVRKGSPLLDKYGSPDLFPKSSYGLRFGEGAYIGRSAERYERTDDVTGSSSKGIMFKHGKKNIMLDDNRRNTYLQSYALASGQEPSVLATFDEERKHLIPVGFQSEYGYARSLARFSAKLGPVAWKVASRKIQRCLPPGVKFGLGWVGENEAPTEKPLREGPSSSLVEGRVDSNHFAQKQEEKLSPVQPNLDDGLSKASCPPIAVIPCNKNIGASKVNAPSFHPRINGLNNNGSSGLHFASQMGKMIGNGAVKPTTHSIGPPSDNNGSSKETSDGLANCALPQKGCSEPPDLNVGFHSPGSPCSLVQTDLALQL